MILLKRVNSDLRERRRELTTCEKACAQRYAQNNTRDEMRNSICDTHERHAWAARRHARAACVTACMTRRRGARAGRRVCIGR